MHRHSADVEVHWYCSLSVAKHFLSHFIWFPFASEQEQASVLEVLVAICGLGCKFFIIFKSFFCQCQRSEGLNDVNYIGSKLFEESFLMIMPLDYFKSPPFFYS